MFVGWVALPETIDVDRAGSVLRIKVAEERDSGILGPPTTPVLGFSLPLTVIIEEEDCREGILIDLADGAELLEVGRVSGFVAFRDEGRGATALGSLSDRSMVLSTSMSGFDRLGGTVVFLSISISWKVGSSLAILSTTLDDGREEPAIATASVASVALYRRGDLRKADGAVGTCSSCD